MFLATTRLCTPRAAVATHTSRATLANGRQCISLRAARATPARFTSTDAAARALLTSSLRPRLVVVDREREVSAVLRMFNTWHGYLAEPVGAPRPKPPLHFSSQLFGAGKTTFGQNLLHLLCADLAKPPEQRAIEPLALREFGLPRAVLERYANAGHVGVDLQNIADTFPTFRSALWGSLLMAAGAALDHPLVQSRGVVTPTVVVDELVRLTSARDGKQRSHVYIFIDEIGAVDSVALQDAYPSLRASGHKHGAYSVLLAALKPLLNDARVLMFVAGKSERLTDLTLQGSTSPLELQFLPLSPLQPHHIDELVHRSSATDANTGQSRALERVFRDELGMSDTALLARRIAHYTAGVPRFVERVLRSLLALVGRAEFARSLANEASIDALLEGAVFTDVFDSVSTFVRLELLSPGDRAGFTDMLLRMLSDFTFVRSEAFKSGAFAGKRVIDVLNVLGFYVASAEAAPASASTPLRPVLPRYVLMWLRDHGGLEKLEAQGGDVLVLLALSAPRGALDQGRFFELLLARRLAARLNAASVSLFPGDKSDALAGTMLSDVLATLQQRAQRALFTVALHGGKTAAKAHSTVVRELSENLEAFIPRNTVVLGRVSTAKFADVFVRLPRGTGGGDHFLGVAGKNYQSEDDLSWSDVQQEIDVFAPVLVRTVCGLLPFFFATAFQYCCCGCRLFLCAEAWHGDVDCVQHATARPS